MIKTTYKPLPQIAENNVTLLLSESTGLNIKASISHAKEILHAAPYAKVLYINTVQTARSLFESAVQQGLRPNKAGVALINGNANKAIQFLTIPRGDLYRWRDTIAEYIRSESVEHIIINSWEFTSRNSRYREEAIFLMKELVNGIEDCNPVSVIAYAEEIPKSPIAGKINRSGFGKLAAIAELVVKITLEYNTEDLDQEIAENKNSETPTPNTEHLSPAIDMAPRLPNILSNYKPNKEPAIRINTIRPSANTSIRPEPKVHSDVIQK